MVPGEEADRAAVAELVPHLHPGQIGEADLQIVERIKVAGSATTSWALCDSCWGDLIRLVPARRVPAARRCVLRERCAPDAESGISRVCLGFPIQHLAYIERSSVGAQISQRSH